MPAAPVRPESSPIVDPLDPAAEFDRQVTTLLEKGYPALAGLTTKAFTGLLLPLRDRLDDVPADTDGGHLPFVVVIRSTLVPTIAAMEQVHVGTTSGYTDMDADELETFVPINEIELPDADVYLMVDIDAGRRWFNVRPVDVLPQLLAEGRSPVTIDEGIAMLTHFPELLAGKERDCYSILGSRCTNKRVTAMWVSRGRPRLGWCFNGAPHTWLGSASCASRR